jgi:nucleoside-diphosphate-sugar epimerase
MLNCGITGSTGILGSNVIKNLKFNFIIFKGDITKKKAVENWIKLNEFDFILHLAAIVPTINVENNYKYAKKVNYSGTRNLVDAIVKYKKKVKNIFLASTSHVYKIQNKDLRINENQRLEPYSKYGKTKLLAENYFRENLKNNKIKYCIGRIFSYTDPKQNNTFLAPGLFSKIKKSNKKVINFKGLNHYRDFLSIKDIINAIKILCLKKKTGTYNIGSGKKVNLESIARIFCKKLNKKAIFFKNSNDFTYLISNNQKLCKIGWKPKVDFIKELNRFK